MFLAQWAWTSRKRPSSTTRPIAFLMLYGWFALSGTSVSSASSARSRIAPARRGRSSRLFDGRYEQVLDRPEGGPVVVGREVRDPRDLVVGHRAAERSLGTSSWVTVLMTSGPVMNMDVSRPSP
jgi:hypothetical protein